MELHSASYTDICDFSGSKFVFLLPQKPPAAFSTGANLLFAPVGRKKGIAKIFSLADQFNQMLMRTDHVKTTAGERKNKGGRPKLKVKRDKVLRIRMSATEVFLIRSKARDAGMRASTWIRLSARTASIAPRWTPEQMQLLRMLSGIANNLNQLAKQANSGRLLFIAQKCDTVLEEIDQALKFLNNDDGQSDQIRQKL